MKGEGGRVGGVGGDEGISDDVKDEQIAPQCPTVKYFVSPLFLSSLCPFIGSCG